MVRRVFLVLLVTLALGLVGTATAGAVQPASPTSAQPGAVCDVTPQPVDELFALAFPAGTPAAALATPISIGSESELPQGEPADAATAAAVERVVQTWLVCLMAGDEARFFGLMTDDLDAAFIQQVVGLAIADTPDELRSMLESDLPRPLIFGSTGALATLGREVRVLDDGRVGGIWTAGGNDAFIILEQQDGRWLIDEVIDIIDG